MSRSRLVAAAVCLAVAAAGAAGCGGGDESAASEQESGKPVPVRMASLGVASDAAMRLGVEKGFFRRQDIDLRLEQVEAGGAAVVPAILKGEYAVAGGGIDGPILGAAKGLDLKIIGKDGAPVSKGDTPKTAGKQATTGIAVPKDSDVRSFADLKGAQMGAITVSGLQYLCIAGAVKKAGVEPKDVKVLEIPAPEMLPALDAGRVKAATLVEPFLSMARQQGYRILGDPCVETMPGAIQAGFFTSGKWAKDNPDVVRRLADALVESNRYADEHPDEIRALIPTYTKISPKLAERIALTPYEAADGNTLGVIADGLLANGLIKQKADISRILTG